MLDAPKKPDDALCAPEHVGRVLGLGDRASVAEDEHVRIDQLGRVVHGLHALDGLVEGDGRLGADRPRRRETHVRHEHVGSGLGHPAGIVRIEDVGSGQKTLLARAV